MGWFSGSTKIYVSSVVYNLAGDIALRPNFLKTAVVGAVLSDVPSIPESVNNSYLHGPGLRLKSFARWARTGTFDADIGMSTGVLTTGHSINLSALAGQIPTSSAVEVQSASIGDADYTAWGDQYVAVNQPSKLNTAYTVTLARIPDILPHRYTYSITITYADLTTDTFTPVGYSPLRSYLYATYLEPFYIGATRYWGTPKLFIYEAGTGNATLDAMWAPSGTLGTFFPFIPFRIDNAKVPDLYPTTIYPEAKKAFKKAVNGSYDKIMGKIDANPSIGDIDYAYAVFGASLNTKEQSAKKYIYRFFKAVLDDPNQSGQTAFVSWQAQWNEAQASWDAWVAWKATQPVELVGPNGQRGDVPFSDESSPEPERIPFPAMPINSISVTSNGNAIMDYNMTMEWRYIIESTGTGMVDPEGKKDHVSIVTEPFYDYTSPIWERNSADGRYMPTTAKQVVMDSLIITYQVDATTWKRLTIAGLVHKNTIYHGNAVVIGCREAMEDVNESGFIVPLHEDIYKSMSIKDYTQMSTACCYLVFNCYEVVKAHWYETGWFQILLIVGIVMVSVLTLGVGTVGATAGVLGTNAGVGAALGLAAGTLIAVVVGAVVNSLAAMILLMVLTKGATAAFGDKLGGLISSILAIVATVTMQISSGLKSGQSLSSIFKDLTSATKLIDLTSSAGNTFADYIKADTQDILGQINSYQKELTGKIKSVEDQAAALFGYDKGTIDPTMFTDAGSANFVSESLATFLDRTLMTGSEIAELSMSMISDFAKLTLNTDLLPS